MGHTDGYGTYGRTWDIRTDMGHTEGHGTYGRTWDIRKDMGLTDGHGTFYYCDSWQSLAAELLT